MHRILIGPYAPDRLRSMERYVRLLAGDADLPGTSEGLAPEPVFWLFARGPLRKWAGYCDKYVLFPRRLRRIIAMRREHGLRVLVHLADQGYAPLLRAAAGVPSLATVHDLMALRAARGEFPGVTVSASGRRLQAWIQSSLARATAHVCVSEATCADLERLVPAAVGRTRVIHPALDPAVRVPAAAEQEAVARQVGLPGNYLLHVGHNAWYKNRDGVLDTYLNLHARLGAATPDLVVVGDPWTPAQVSRIRTSGLESKVHRHEGLADGALAACYARARLLLFPSRCEGFGWPPVEAQACGCPVVASPAGSLREVLQTSALLAAPEDTEALALACARILTESTLAVELRRQGLANAARFTSAAMLAAYRQVYAELPARPC